MESVTSPPEVVHGEASLWEDFVDIYYAPRQVFERRVEGGRWGIVLLIVTAVMALLYFAGQSVLGPLFDAEFSRAMQENPNLTAEQLAQAREMAATFGLIAFTVTFPVAVVITGFLLWGIGKLFDSVATVGGALLIATYAQFPRLPQQALGLLQGLVLDVGSMRSIYGVSFSPARFMDPAEVSQLVMAIAGRLDLFVLWSTVLLAIGLQAIGRVPRMQAYVTAGIVWALGAAPMILGALAQPG